MKCSFWSLILCYTSLVIGEYLQNNLFNTALKKKNFDEHLKLPRQQLVYSNTPTHLRLFRRVSTPPGRQSPQRQQANGAIQTHVQASARGPGRISAGHNPALTTVENVRDEDIPHGQHSTMQTSHGVASFALAQAHGFPPPNAAQQPVEEHPAKASSQGRRAFGIASVPVGGRGFMRLERPDRVETQYIPGGQIKVESIAAHHPGDAKAEVSVTRGGNTYAAGTNAPGPLL